MYKNKFSIVNKIIIVCGGSGQIGRNLVNYLLSKEAIVINLDVQKLKISKNNNYFFYKIDLRNERSIINILKKIDIKFEKIDVLVNLFHFKGKRKLSPHHEFFSEFHKYPFSLWKDTIDTNLNGLFLICKNVIGYMVKKRSGVIVNTASTYGIVSPKHDIYGNSGINSPISYATTKSAIINFTRYISTYYSKYNIRANSISPGGIQNKNQSHYFKKKYSANTPLGRLAKEDEFNESILFLISDASSYMTGSNLIIDGGWTSW